MKWRAHEWSERLSAVVLLGASLLVAHWSRARVATTEAALDRRERQIEQVSGWVGGRAPADGPFGVVDCTGLFGEGVELVYTSSFVGHHVSLRAAAEVAR